MDLKEQCVKQTYYYRGMIQLRDDEVRLPNGLPTRRVVVEHPGAAAVVASDPQGRIVLVRQYRYPIEENLLEIPAGKLDAGEDPEKCARRELNEETGLTARTLVPLGAIYTSPGFCNERIYLFWAACVDGGEAAPHDPDEFLQVVRMDPAQALEMAASGKLEDCKTVCGILSAAARGLLQARP